MSKVVSLTGGSQAAAGMEPQQAIIDVLERMLAEAKDGRIQHLVAVYSDGRTFPIDLYQGSGEPGQVAALIGGLEFAKYTMMMTQYQEQPA